MTEYIHKEKDRTQNVLRSPHLVRLHTKHNSTRAVRFPSDTAPSQILHQVEYEASQGTSTYKSGESTRRHSARKSREAQDFRHRLLHVTEYETTRYIPRNAAGLPCSRFRTQHCLIRSLLLYQDTSFGVENLGLKREIIQVTNSSSLSR